MAGRADECGAEAETYEDAAAQLRERAFGAWAAPEPAAERSGEQDIGAVAEHGKHREDRSEDEYLSNHRAGRWTDKLRQQRQKEDRDLWV